MKISSADSLLKLEKRVRILKKRAQLFVQETIKVMDDLYENQ